jgi:hypothetical protein
VGPAAPVGLLLSSQMHRVPIETREPGQSPSATAR